MPQPTRTIFVHRLDDGDTVNLAILDGEPAQAATTLLKELGSYLLEGDLEEDQVAYDQATDETLPLDVRFEAVGRILETHAVLPGETGIIRHSEPPLALACTPDAIRAHFEDGPEDEQEIAEMTDEELTRVGELTLDADSLYWTWHSTLKDAAASVLAQRDHQ